MKLLTFFLAGFLLGNISIAGTAGVSGYRRFVAPDAVQSDLKGKVRVIRERTSELKDGIEEPTSSSESTYDADGYLVDGRDTNLTDGKTETTTRFYDAEGNLVAQEETSGSRTVKKTVRLLPERNRVVWEVESGDRKTIVAETTFDRFGKEGEIREFDEKGELTGIYRTKRDTKGLETEVIFGDALGKPETIVTVTGDERVFAASDEHDDRVEKVVVKTTYEYPEVDGQGNWTRQVATKKFFEKGREKFTARDVTTRTIEYY